MFEYNLDDVLKKEKKEKKMKITELFDGIKEPKKKINTNNKKKKKKNNKTKYEY